MGFVLREVSCMSHLPLRAHSLAEAYLYVMVSPCESCGGGPLYGGEARGVESGDGSWSTTLPATCGACGATTSTAFQLANRPEEQASDDSACVNPTDEPSRIIDVGQWLTLFRMITEAAAREDDKVQARHLGMEAALCLDEALSRWKKEILVAVLGQPTLSFRLNTGAYFQELAVCGNDLMGTRPMA